MTRQLVRIGTAIMVTLLALVILWQLRIAVIYVFISLALAAALRPLANHLVGRGFVIRVISILLYLAVVVSFGCLLYFTGGMVSSEVQSLAHNISALDAWRLPTWLEGTAFQQTLITRLPPPSILFEAITGNQGQLILPTLIGFTQSIGVIVSGVLIVLFLSIYWSINQIHFERLWLSLLPPGQRKQARGVWRTVEPDLGAYIRGQVAQSLLAGLVLGLGYWLLGSPYPALLAVAGALACLIPMVAIPLVILPVLLVGLLTSLELGLFTTLYSLVVLVMLGIWIKPRLFKQQWDNPILTLVLLIALAKVFGLLGIILAPPLSAICQILWSRLVSHRHAIGAADLVSDLKTRQIHVWESIHAMGESTPPLITNSMQRLTALIDKAEPVIKAALTVEPSISIATPVPLQSADKKSGPKRTRKNKG